MAKVTFNVQLHDLKGETLRKDLQFDEGDWYDGDAIGRTADAIEADVHTRGYSFVVVNPDITRHPDKHTIDVVFNVIEGPRLYVERIDIVGNVRTKDKVIRREFRVAEGDAFSAEAVRRSRQRLQDLGYFNTVTVEPTPGSAPDKTVLTTTVSEKSTGSVTVGGGYATDAGALLDAGISENNLIGTGISASVNGVLAQRDSSINASVTDPYFLDRNLVAGADVFVVQTNYLGTEPYDEKRVGLRAAHGLRLQRASAPGLELLAGRPDRVQCRVECQLLCPGRRRLHAAVAGQPATHAGLSRQQGRPAQRRELFLRHRCRRTGRQCAVRPHACRRQVLHSRWSG